MAASPQADSQCLQLLERHWRKCPSAALAEPCTESNNLTIQSFEKHWQRRWQMDGETAEAIDLYESIVNPIPTNSKLAGPWASACPFRTAQSEQGLLSKVLSINPNEPRAKANLLTIFKQTGEFKAAQDLIDALDEGAATASRYPQGHRRPKDRRRRQRDSKPLPSSSLPKPSKPSRNWLNWAASLKSLKFTVAPTKILKRGLQFNPEDNNLWISTRASTI